MGNIWILYLIPYFLCIILMIWLAIITFKINEFKKMDFYYLKKSLETTDKNISKRNLSINDMMGRHAMMMHKIGKEIGYNLDFNPLGRMMTWNGVMAKCECVNCDCDHPRLIKIEEEKTEPKND